MDARHVGLALALAAVSLSATARDHLYLVGAPYVLSLIQPVAEQFAQHSRNPVPSMEATGNGAGFRLFCAGVGLEHPDLVSASRPITEGERAHCAANGVTEITEIEFARDALVLINAGNEPRINLTPSRLFVALAGDVEREGRLIPNPVTKWSEIDSSLPARPILIMGPEPNTVAETALQELVMTGACPDWPTIQALAPAERERICRKLRRDARLVPAAKHEEKVFAWLKANPDGLALTNFATYQHFAGRTAANPIGGYRPP